METTRYESSGDFVVSNFLLKLISLLDTPVHKKYASWEEQGKSFIIHDQAGFSRLILPKYFKHNKFSSFVRQLNMYGFRKVPNHNATSGMESLHESIEFYHPLFERGKLERLHLIKRKVTQTSKASSDEVAHVAEEVQHLKAQNRSNTVSISNLKRQNQELWQEVVRLRNKNDQNSQTLQAMFKFLVRLATPTSTHPPLKRHQLMIDCGDIPAKMQKGIADKPEAVQGLTNIEIIQNEDQSSSNGGPLITELLTSSMDAANAASEDLATPNIQSPENFDYNSLLASTGSSENLKIVPMNSTPVKENPRRLVKLSFPGAIKTNALVNKSRQVVPVNSLNNNKQLVLAPASSSADPSSLIDSMWSSPTSSNPPSTSDFVNDLQNRLAEGHLVLDKSVIPPNSINSFLESLSPSVTPDIDSFMTTAAQQQQQQSIQQSQQQQQEQQQVSDAANAQIVNDKALANYEAPAAGSANLPLAFNCLDEDVDVGHYCDLFNFENYDR